MWMKLALAAAILAALVQTARYENSEARRVIAVADQVLCEGGYR
jgi:hypothetical protein